MSFQSQARTGAHSLPPPPPPLPPRQEAHPVWQRRPVPFRFDDWAAI